MPNERVQLADWRRRVADMYSNIRELDSEQAWNALRIERDLLLKTHPQSPLSESQREKFNELEFFPYDTKWRVFAPLEPSSSGESIVADLGEDGDFRMTEIGQVLIQSDARLSLFWVEGYGG